MEYNDISGTGVLAMILIVISVFTIAFPIGEAMFRHTWDKPNPKVPIKWAVVATITPIFILMVECCFLNEITGHGMVKYKYSDMPKRARVYEDKEIEGEEFYLVIQVGGFMGDMSHIGVLKHEYQRMKIGDKVKTKYAKTRITGSLHIISIN